MTASFAFDSGAFVECTAEAISGTARWRREADYTADRGPTLIAQWQAAPGHAEIQQDRLGMLPVFWWADGARFVASPSLLEVARRSGARELDWDAIAGFLAIGNYLDQDTPFLGIKTVPPGATLKWRAGSGAQIHPPPFVPLTPFSGTKAEAKRIYAELFSQAVRRRLPDDLARVTVPVSGGRDSRHIAFEIAAQTERPVDLLTIRCAFGPTDEDVRVAARVAERLGWSHTVIDIDWARYLEWERVKNFHTHFLVDEDHHAMFELAQSRALKGRWVFFGIGGDMLIGDAYFSYDVEAHLRARRLAEAASLELRGYQAPPYLRAAVAERLGRARAARVVIRSMGALAESPNLHRDFMFTRAVRNAALVPFDLVSRRNHVVAPYLDVELLDFQRSLPADPFGPYGLHDEIIAETYPQHADLEYERKGFRERPLFKRRWQAIASAWRNLASRDPAFRELIRRRFVWPRFLRACLGRGIEDMWWLKRAVYLADLLRFSEDPEGYLAMARACTARLLRGRA